MSGYEKQVVQVWLAERLMEHLDVDIRGSHVILYSGDDGDKWNRIRLTRLGGGAYQLAMADHRGKWDPTPFTGTMEQLLDLVASDFPWMLTDD